MPVRWKAQHPTGSDAYYREPYTVQHFTDWAGQMATLIPRFLWYVFRHYTSKTFRIEQARAYNRAMFGNIPTENIFVPDKDTGEYRPLRPEERTWPE
jgi:hypothetical protein